MFSTLHIYQLVTRCGRQQLDAFSRKSNARNFHDLLVQAREAIPNFCHLAMSRPGRDAVPTDRRVERPEVRAWPCSAVTYGGTIIEKGVRSEGRAPHFLTLQSENGDISGIGAGSRYHDAQLNSFMEAFNFTAVIDLDVSLVDVSAAYAYLIRALPVGRIVINIDYSHANSVGVETAGLSRTTRNVSASL